MGGFIKSKLRRGPRRALFVTICSLAWPTMLEQLMQSAVQYIDVAMVGTIGTRATAAVGATSTIGWLIISSLTAFSMGFLSVIARAYGANDMDTARRAVSQAVLSALVIGGGLTCVLLPLSGRIPRLMHVDPAIEDITAEYFFLLYLPILFRTASIFFGTILRSTGDSKTPMKVGIAMNAVNVVFNFLLIYPSRECAIGTVHINVWGAGLGTAGAAIASGIAFTWGGICLTLKLLHHPDVSPAGISLRPDFKILRPCFMVALPNMFQRFCTSLGYVIFASMINSIGETATAAHTIANTVESLFYIPGYGMQTAAATLMGNAYGAGNSACMKRLSSTMVVIEVVLMTASGITLFLCSQSLVALFTRSGEIHALAVKVLRMVALSEPLYGLAVIVEGMLLGVGKTRLPFIFNIMGMWGVRITGTWICTRILHQGLVSAWACMIAHNSLLCFLYLLPFLSGRWNPLYKSDISAENNLALNRTGGMKPGDKGAVARKTAQRHPG